MGVGSKFRVPGRSKKFQKKFKNQLVNIFYIGGTNTAVHRWFHGSMVSCRSSSTGAIFGCGRSPPERFRLVANGEFLTDSLESFHHRESTSAVKHTPAVHHAILLHLQEKSLFDSASKVVASWREARRRVNSIRACECVCACV